jgi:hypothetical protein
LAKNNKDVPLEFRVHATTTQVFTLISDNDAKNLEDIQPVSDEHIETID